MEWTEDLIVDLRALWAEGHATSEIGRIMGISKNAVVGKAHRLELPGRSSPIRRRGPRTAPARIACPARRDRQVPRLPRIVAEPPPPAARPLLPSAAHATATLPAGPWGRVLPCCWPIGEPATPAFHFCDKPSEPAKPYCAEHAALAYVKVRDRHAA